MLTVLKTSLKIVLLRGEIKTIKMNLLVPGSLARIANWKINLLNQLADKEEELMGLESI